MMLRNHYGVDMGASGLIINAQSRAEILADKLVAFALRPNRIKNRDLWDIVWLHQQGTELPLALIPLKLRDHHCALADYSALLQERQASLAADPAIHAAFKQEMRRFVAVGGGQNMGAGSPANIVATENYWQVLCYLMGEHARRITEAL